VGCACSAVVRAGNRALAGRRALLAQSKRSRRTALRASLVTLGLISARFLPFGGSLRPQLPDLGASLSCARTRARQNRRETGWLRVFQKGGLLRTQRFFA
jgi:hypothetical protein